MKYPLPRRRTRVTSILNSQFPICTPLPKGATNEAFALLLVLLLALASGAQAFTPTLLRDGDWSCFGNTPPPYDGIYRPGIYRYDGTDADVTVPASLGGTTMKFIAEGCFTGPGLVSVALPDAPIDLTRQAFMDCPALTLTAPAGSYGLAWAAENDIPCIAK